MAAESVPGHKVPDGVDPRQADAIDRWTEAFGVATMVTRKYGAMLMDEGYDDLYSLEFEESEPLQMEDGAGDKVPQGRGRTGTGWGGRATIGGGERSWCTAYIPEGSHAQLKAVQRLAKLYSTQASQPSANVVEDGQGDAEEEYCKVAASSESGKTFSSSTGAAWNKEASSGLCRQYGRTGKCTYPGCKYEPCKTIRELKEGGQAAAAVVKPPLPKPRRKKRNTSARNSGGMGPGGRTRGG